MNSENIKDDIADHEAVSENNESNLLTFDENNTVSSGRDINTKITDLDTDLAHLRNELGIINSSVEEGLDRLGDSDTDLTAKVSETYKRLGEIDNAYKALLEISSRIDVDIQRLNGDVSDVAVQSASGIKNLEQTSVAQSNEFTQKNQQVVSKVNQLAETSKLTGDLLDQRIKSTTDKMLSIERSVIAEIEHLSVVTKDKTDALVNDIDRNKAKIIKLQTVDEAIIKRATTLEITSAELSVKSQDIQSSVEQLQLNTDSLSTSLYTLRERTRALEDLTKNHGSLITGLQTATSDLGAKLATLAGREKKHFNIASAAFLLLLLITAVIYFAQQGQFADVQNVQAGNTVETNKSIAALESKVEDLNLSMHNELEKEVSQLDHKMQAMQDQVQSVEGRFNNDVPFSQIGNDNVLHGALWISELPKENFTVQLAYVDSKSSLFEIAQRYNHYLKDSLSYFEVKNNGAANYVLLSGNYTTQQQAQREIESMPRYIDRQQPVVRRLQAVQKHIAGS